MGESEAQRRATGAGDPRVVVAILDGPVDLTHPCFAGARLTQLATMVDAANAGGPALAHGTHVASIIFGQPGSEVEGIAPACSGLIVPIFGASGEGKPLTCSQLDLARALLQAAEAGAHIINVSSGQLAASSEPEPILANAIERCAAMNVLIVAAAGNDGCDCLHVPAAAGTVLAVGAMGPDGAPLPSSNWGAAYRSKGLLAPGGDVTVATPGGGTTKRSGTSYAAPYATGAAALLVSLQLAAGGRVDPQIARRALIETANPCPDTGDESCSRFLAGTINFQRAAAAVAASTRHLTTMGERKMTDLDWTNGLNASDEEPFAASAVVSEIGAGESPRPFGESALGVPASAQVEAAGLAPSDCGCGCGGKKDAAGGGCSCGGKKTAGGEGCGCGGGGAAKKPQLVFALGKLGIDFGSEARRDSLLQAMAMAQTEATTSTDVFIKQLNYFDVAPYDAASVIWTLNLDATTVYAIHPAGAYAAQAYERLRQALRAQTMDSADIISVPGVIGGTIRLQSGQQVPVIVPAVRAIYSWATLPLVQHVLGTPPKGGKELELYNNIAAGLSNYLNRVYYDLRNLGLTGEERALNYSATNAVQIAKVMREVTPDGLELDRISVRRSPICRPDSECYDVDLTFFNPANTNTAVRVYRFTIDVSDVIPVTIGSERKWNRRA